MKKAEREELQREKLREMKEFENRFRGGGKVFLAGMDEVGRGPLAGPVVAACVVLPEDFDLPGVDDSKKLSEKKRMQIAPLIRERALAYGLGKADEKIIDRINILEATKGAMKIAVAQADSMLMEKTGHHIDHVLIDAVSIKDLGYSQTAIIKGDSQSVSIAAASIIAKVTRDAMMIKYHEEYPWYSFDKNKGYGTKEHYEGLKEHGPSPIHRRSFIRKIL